MKQPPNPQMAELGPFYQLCWLGLLSSALNPLLVCCWSVSMIRGGWLLAGMAGTATLVALLVTWRVIHVRQKRRMEERVARGVTPSRPRLQQKLEALGDKLRELSGNASARLVLIPESAVVLSTLRSGREPVVEVTASFLSAYASHPRLMEAALAHEAGHLAARDVEQFLRMLSLMRTLAWFTLLFLCFSFFAASGALLIAMRQGVPGIVMLLLLAYFVAQRLVMALVLALAWSALLVAREVQADAFAVKVLGERRPMQALLERQLSLRAAQAGQRNPLQRLRTWLIQPDLRWRSTLPFLRGHLGARVEAKLGLATAAFVSSVWVSLALVAVFFYRLDMAALQDDIVFFKMALGVLAWGSWIAYRFFWVRSRALGRGDSRTRSSGLRSLLYFCLPGEAFFLVWGVCIVAIARLPLSSGLVFAELLPALAVLFWAAGKVSLVSARERRRERPSLPLALLSLLGILALATVVFLLSASALSPNLYDELLPLSLLTTGLGAGMLAHLLATPARTSEPHPDAHPRKRRVCV